MQATRPSDLTSVMLGQNQLNVLPFVLSLHALLQTACTHCELSIRFNISIAFICVDYKLHVC